MNDAIIDRICARHNHGISTEDEVVFRRMASYLDRSSLKIVWDDGAQGRALRIHCSDDALRYEFTLAELINLWADLRMGKPINWSSLREVPKPGF
jgi:hypothetical protein